MQIYVVAFIPTEPNVFCAFIQSPIALRSQLSCLRICLRNESWKYTRLLLERLSDFMAEKLARLEDQLSVPDS
jgi:hypothetical protein